MATTEFQIRATSDGRFEIFEIAKLSQAIVASRDMANEFVDFLIARRGAQLAEAPADEQAPPQKPAAPEPEPPQADIDAPAPAIEPAAEAMMDAAFSRLERGDPMKEVAEEAGISFYQLRGRWAASARARKAAAADAAEQPHIADGMAECRLCGREHKARLGGDDLCARCSRDMVG